MHGKPNENNMKLCFFEGYAGFLASNVVKVVEFLIFVSCNVTPVESVLKKFSLSMIFTLIECVGNSLSAEIFEILSLRDYLGNSILTIPAKLCRKKNLPSGMRR